MRAFLPIILTELENKEFVPAIPVVVLEHEGHTAFYNSGWTRPMQPSCLEKVTNRDVRQAMQLSSKEPLFFSDIRELPHDDLSSPEFIAWAREWWQATVAPLRASRSSVIAKAS